MKDRRSFIKAMGVVGLGTAVMPALGFAKAQDEKQAANAAEAALLAEEGVEKVSVFQTTDVHCQLHPHDELFWENDAAVYRKTGGYAYLAALLNDLRAANPNNFTVDTGDMFQGSELAVHTSGKAFVPILNQLQYNLFLPGNWEVVYGKKNMQQLMGALNAPKICSNMYHDLGAGNKGELIFQPYHIWHTAGIKIGFLGYTDPLVPLRQSPMYSAGIRYTEPSENLAHYVDVLRNQEQCAYVIIIAHLGLSQQIALANHPACQGVDYIFGGDTHERVRKPIVCTYAKVVEPGAFGSFIGKLDLYVKDGKVIRDTYELLEVTASKITPDAAVANLVAQVEQPYTADINRIVGYSTLPLYRYFVVENPIDTLVLQALHAKHPEVDVVLSNGFRFCPPNVTRDHTGNIPITNGFIYDMLPVDSTIRIGKVSGLQIRNWLEKELNNVFAQEAAHRFGGWVVKFKGMEVTFEAFATHGQRVKSIQIGGKPLEEQQTYRILACEREGDPDDMLCRMKNVREAFNTESTLHDAMLAYLKTHSPVTPTPPKAAVILDAPDTLLSQVTGVDYTFV
ncbi:bifunctional metallophosphatase/5'-nucleotidase [Flavobacterium sp. JP2137]|uniref:bifunctional metallophosphatase/5'-nucleotidase n=1 Tax=Flavobacterium sp. JP2137 TaxID=3414510 RepID=UPI003D2FBEF4